MTDLLHRLRQLDAKATPGEVLLETVEDEGGYLVTYVVHPVTTTCDRTAICEVIDAKYGPAIVAALNLLPEIIEGLKEKEAMRAAMLPFALVAERDVGDDEHDTDLYRPMSHNHAPHITIGDLRRARDLVTPPTAADGER